MLFKVQARLRLVKQTQYQYRIGTMEGIILSSTLHRIILLLVTVNGLQTCAPFIVVFDLRYGATLSKLLEVATMHQRAVPG